MSSADPITHTYTPKPYADDSNGNVGIEIENPDAMVYSFWTSNGL
jgi:hypothetical protein